jgi:hypothetical protein
MKGFTNWKKLLGILLVFGVLGLTACNSGTSGDTGTVTPPPSDGGNGGGGGGGGGGGNLPPPTTSTAWGFDVKFCTTVQNVAEILVKEREISWGKSMDEFRFSVMYVKDGWSCFEGRVERDQPKFWHGGKWDIAIFYGNSFGEDRKLANGGMAKNKIWVNGVYDPCMLIGRQYQGELQAIVNDSPSLAHTIVNITQDGVTTVYEEFLACNYGDQCPVDCKQDIPDDGFHDADRDH